MEAVETPDFISLESRRLYCVRHIPPGSPRGVAVVCHPFGEEKKSSHRTLVDLARALARTGIAAIRFDFSGCGDSSGDLREATVEAWKRDVEAALDSLQSLVKADLPVVVVGLRLGAAIASEFAADRADVAGLVLWQPIVNGRKAFMADLRRTLIKQMMTDGSSKVTRDELLEQLEGGEGEIDLDGFPFTGRLYQGIAGIDLLAQEKPYDGALAVFQISHNEKLQPDFAQLADAYRAGGADVDLQTVVAPPLWARIERVDCPELIDRTVAWIRDRCEEMA